MTTILVKNILEAIHCWPEAPDEVGYLKYPHRHLFHIETEIEVHHDDRDLEFMMVQHELMTFLSQENLFPLSVSCEQIARAVGQHIVEVYGARTVTVTVREDNENGARVYYDKENLL